MFMNHILLYTKLLALPEKMKSQVSDFIDKLQNKSSQKKPAKKPKFGSGKGVFKIKAGFDLPIEDFKEYMGK